MEEKCKKIAWLQLGSIFVALLGTIFGILAITRLKFTEENKGIEYAIIAIIAVGGLIMIITSIIAFISSRKGYLKNAIVTAGRNSIISSVGPIVSFGLGLWGIYGTEFKNKTISIFLIVTFLVSVFATGLVGSALKAFRKDKENYSYTSLTSWISVGALGLFALAAMICELQIPPLPEYGPLVGFLIAFSLLFVLADIINYVELALLAGVAKKYAPKKTVADADAAVLDNIATNVDKLAKGKQTNIDPVSEIKRYKSLMDEGIITKEEFEAKKKDLLK